MSSAYSPPVQTLIDELGRLPGIGPRSAQRIAYTYRIIVTNLLPTSAKINVLDQYPIPHEENIKVQRDKPQPEPTEQTDLGILTWTFELAPNAKQEMTLAFTVEYPRDAFIGGLED